MFFKIFLKMHVFMNNINTHVGEQEQFAGSYPNGYQVKREVCKDVEVHKRTTRVATPVHVSI